MSQVNSNQNDTNRNRNLIRSLSKNYESLIKAEKEVLLNKNDVHKIINYLDSNKFQHDFAQEYSRHKIYEQDHSSINSSFQQESLRINNKPEKKFEFPSAYLHGLFCLDVYENESKSNASPILKQIRETDKQNEWNIYKVVEIESRQYKSMIYLNKIKKQMVLVHKSFDEGIKPFANNQKLDYEDILISQIIPQLAVCFQITKQANAIAVANNYNLSFTGYSHGAWLSQYSFYFARKFLNNMSTKALLFESPGAIIEYDSQIYSDENLVVYLSAPSLANTSNKHFGKVFQIFVEENSKDFTESQKFVYSVFNDLAYFDEIKDKILSSVFLCEGIYSILNQHKLKALVEALKYDCIEEVIRWPQIEVEQRNQSSGKSFGEMVETHVSNILSTQQFPKVFQSIPYELQECIIKNTTSGLLRNLMPSLHTVLKVITEFDKKTNLDSFANRDDFYRKTNVLSYQQDYETRKINKFEDTLSLNQTTTTCDSYEPKCNTSDDRQSVSSSIFNEIDYLLGQDANSPDYPVQKLDLLICKVVGDCKNLASRNKLDEMGAFYETMIKIRNFVARTKLKVKRANYLGLLCLLSLYEYKVSMNLNNHLSLELEIQETMKQLLPQNHPVLAESFINLGEIYYKMDNKDKAIEYFQLALKTTKKAKKEFHPGVTHLLSTLGKIYNELGESNMAITYYTELLRIIKTSSATNAEIPAVLNRLAKLYWDINETQIAITYYSEVLEFRRKHCPENYSEIANTYNNLGAAYTKLGQTNIAISFYHESIQLKDHLPKNSPHIAISFNNLAAAFSKFGNVQQAIEYYNESLKLTKNSNPINKVAISSTLYNLASCYTKLNDHSTAYRFYTEALENIKQILPENNQFRINLTNSLKNSMKSVNKIEGKSTKVSKK